METVVFAFVLIVFFYISLWAIESSGYEKGQIDALTGNIKYTLVEFKNGVREWRKTSTLKDLKEYKIVENGPQ